MSGYLLLLIFHYIANSVPILIGILLLLLLYLYNRRRKKPVRVGLERHYELVTVVVHTIYYWGLLFLILRSASGVQGAGTGVVFMVMLGVIPIGLLVLNPILSLLATEEKRGEVIKIGFLFYTISILLSIFVLPFIVNLISN